MHFPELGAPSPATYARWFEEICRRTAVMIAEWMRVGFVHGVMNTDNMSILGLTIDYGPYGWLEGYDPRWTPNTTDAEGRRYCYGNQPQIAQWNLVRLANALLPLIDDKAPLEQGLAVFGETFERASSRMLAGKLGLVVARPGRRRRAGERAVRVAAAGRDRHDACSSATAGRRAGAATQRTTARWSSRCAAAFYAEEAFAPAQRGRAGGLAAPLHRAGAAGCACPRPSAASA